MRRTHLLFLAGLFLYALSGCGDDSGGRANKDAGLNPDVDASVKHDSGNTCGTCGACEQPLTLNLIDDATGKSVDVWSAHITGNGADCTATSSFDSCVSELEAGTYSVAITVQSNTLDTKTVTIEPTHPAANACCDCGYVAKHLDVHFQIACDGDGGVSDGGEIPDGSC
jgi:hypothetical protein